MLAPYAVTTRQLREVMTRAAAGRFKRQLDPDVRWDEVRCFHLFTPVLWEERKYEKAPPLVRCVALLAANGQEAPSHAILDVPVDDFESFQRLPLDAVRVEGSRQEIEQGSVLLAPRGRP